MLNKVIWIIPLIIFTFSCKPKNVKLAEKISGLDLSTKIEEISYKSYSQNLTGTGYLIMVYRVSDEQLGLIKDQIGEDYHPLPIIDAYAIKEIKEYYNSSINGFFRLQKSENDPLKYSIVVIDLDNKKLIIAQSNS